MKTFKLNENLFFIDGFYYGVSDEVIEVNELCIFNHPEYGYIIGKWKGNGFDYSMNSCSTSVFEFIHTNLEPKRNKIIFTNNPSISLPQLVFLDKEDEIEKLLQNICNWDSFKEHPIGKQAQQALNLYKTNPNRWSDEDMIGFVRFIDTIHRRYKKDSIENKLRLYKSKEKIVESFDVIYEEGELLAVDDNGKRIREIRPKVTNGKIIALNVKYK